MPSYAAAFSHTTVAQNLLFMNMKGLIKKNFIEIVVLGDGGIAAREAAPVLGKREWTGKFERAKDCKIIRLGCCNL